MIESRHVSQDELLELINGDGESAKSKSIGEHVHQCEECRRALDALVAKSAIWQKVPGLLKDNPMSTSGSYAPIQGERTEAFPRPPQKDEDEENWQYPIDQLLDPPNHPEMLGRIGKYDIEREIGRGGMGVVLKAHDAELNRPLAIKILAPHLASHGTARKRFAQEAVAAAGVLHPNVIAIHGVNNEGKTPYMVMPFVAGSSLQALVDRQGPLTELEIVRIALQIAAGLAAAHSQGLVHRDVKPANILVESDVNRVLITDFGLARAEDDASLTRTGWLTGTPNYMSPEQARGDRPDQRSDLFSLGSLIYFLASGRLPFRSESPLGVLNRIQNDEPTPVRQINNQISETLSDIISVLLQKDPADRFQTSAELHELLEKHLAYLHQPDISKPPRVSLAVRSAEPNGLGRRIVAGGLVAALLGLIIAFSGIFGPPPENANQKQSSPDQNPVTVLPIEKQETEDQDSEDQGSEDRDSDKDNESCAKSESKSNEEPKSNKNAKSETKTKSDKKAKSEWKVTSESSSSQGSEPIIVVTPNDEEEDGSQYYSKGVEHFYAGKYDDAIGAFEKSAAFAGHQANSNYNIACCWAKKGNMDKAFVSLNNAVDTGYSDINNFVNDGDLESLRDDKRFDRVGERIERLNDSADCVSEATDYANLEYYDKASRLCREALKLNPNNERAVLYLGYSLHMGGNLKEALPWHQRTAKSERYGAVGKYNLSCLNAMQNNPDKAFKYLDDSIDSGLTRFVNLSHLEEDSDLDNIRQDERFEKAIQKFIDSTPLESRFGGIRIVRSHGSVMVSSRNQGQMAEALQDANEITGTWESQSEDGRLKLAILVGDTRKEWYWGYLNDFKPSDFEPNLGDGVTEFRLEREPGHIEFNGSFTDQVGKGEFRFVASNEYRQSLEDQGIQEVPELLMFRLFFAKNKEKIIDNLKDLQELGLSKKALRVLMIEGVKAKTVKEYQKADLSIDDNLSFLAGRVSAKLLTEYTKAGFDLQENERFINRRVPAKLLSEYKDAKLDLKENDQFIQWRVRASLLKHYKEKDLDPHQYAEFVNHRVQPCLLKGYKDAGLDPIEYRRFVNWHVDPKLVKSYQAADLDLRRHRDFINSRVPAETVKSYSDAGLNLRKYRKFIRSHVPSKLVTGYHDAGYDPIELRELIQARVEPALLQKYEKAGLEIEEHRKYIKRHMDPAQVLERRKKDSDE